MEKADIESAELMIEAKFDQDDDPSSSRRFPPRAPSHAWEWQGGTVTSD